MTAGTNFVTSAPGRICLFGEHQDYLGMPAVVMAMNRRCRIRFVPRSDRLVFWKSPALGPEYGGHYDLDALERASQADRPDFFLSSLIEAGQKGELPRWGWDATILSSIPVQAGCSSSSALVIAWIAGVERLAGRVTRPELLASKAHLAEVVFFGGPGGAMDHYACSMGGLIRFDPSLPSSYRRFTEPDLLWVLGDSKTPKDTLGNLSRCKRERVDILDRYGGDWDRIEFGQCSTVEFDLVAGTVRNRNIERDASEFLGETNQSMEVLGAWMTEHHAILRDVLLVSTPRIDQMSQAALGAGALGAKIVGSGGGGCMVAMVDPSQPGIVELVLTAVRSIGGVAAYEVRCDRGVDWDDRDDTGFLD